MKWLLFPLFLAGCHSGPYQNLAELKSELFIAKERLTTAHDRVVQLEEEIARQEIARISQEIDKIQDQDPDRIYLTKEERLVFFSQQREILAQIIKDGLTCSGDAQIVLNKILTYITEMSDTSLE